MPDNGWLRFIAKIFDKIKNNKTLKFSLIGIAIIIAFVGLQYITIAMWFSDDSSGNKELDATVVAIAAFQTMQAEELTNQTNEENAGSEDNDPLPAATNTSAPAATNTSAPAATNTSAPAATNTSPPPTNTPVPPTNTPVPMGTVKVHVWKDVSWWGSQQGTEFNYPGVVVYLRRGSCPLNISKPRLATTAISGDAIFNNVTYGTYCVSIGILHCSEEGWTYLPPEHPAEIYVDSTPILWVGIGVRFCD